MRERKGVCERERRSDQQKDMMIDRQTGGRLRKRHHQLQSSINWGGGGGGERNVYCTQVEKINILSLKETCVLFVLTLNCYGVKPMGK